MAAAYSTLCPVSVWEGPAGVEREGRPDHPRRPEGPAQRAILCVARGLPVAQGSKVGSLRGMSGPALFWMLLVTRAKMPPGAARALGQLFVLSCVLWVAT